jgi:hypothetical protein
MKHIQLFKEFITEKSTNGNIDPDELAVGQKVEMEHTSSRDEAMKSILDEIKYLITIDKSNENIKIRNVKTLETLSVDELKTRLNNGDFKHLYDVKSKS